MVLEKDDYDRLPPATRAPVLGAIDPGASAPGFTLSSAGADSNQLTAAHLSAR